jgi:peptidoglycan hydrolase-like protein with peptidoglycan-binding domain
VAVSRNRLTKAEAEAAARRREAREARRAALALRKQVQADQRALKRVGYYKGPIDGKDGERLTVAIKEFRVANKLPAEAGLDEGARSVLVGGSAVPKASCETPSEERRKIQAALAELGLFKAVADGCPSAASIATGERSR